MFSATPDFVTFLRSAKVATYAQGDAASVLPLLPDSKQLEFSSGPYIYRDVYVGAVRFVGQEMVYLDNRAPWSMVYSGGLTAGVAKTDMSSIYQALRAALSQVPEALPVRGPLEFQHHGLLYRCAATGSIERFHGHETIMREDSQVVYELQFSGGGLE